MERRVPPRAAWRTVESVPRPKKPSVPILKIVPTLTHKVVILSHCLHEVWVHYIDGRTCPCTGEAGACEYDHEKTSLRWQGWMAVQRINVAEQRLMWMTPTAIDCEPRLRTLAGHLRGFTLECGRVRNAANGSIWAKLGEDNISARVFPDVNVWEQLDRMFNAATRRADPKLTMRAIWDALKPKEGGVR